MIKSRKELDAINNTMKKNLGILLCSHTTIPRGNEQFYLPLQ